ncbi:MAG: glutaredoxin domain-containing protein [Methanoregula sp.]
MHVPNQQRRAFRGILRAGRAAIKEFLTAKHVEFEEIDLASNDAARATIIEKTGHPGVPIVQIRDEFIFGYDPKKMESLLK